MGMWTVSIWKMFLKCQYPHMTSSKVLEHNAQKYSRNCCRSAWRTIVSWWRVKVLKWNNINLFFTWNKFFSHSCQPAILILRHSSICPFLCIPQQSVSCVFRTLATILYSTLVVYSVFKHAVLVEVHWQYFRSSKVAVAIYSWLAFACNFTWVNDGLYTNRFCVFSM